VAMLDLPFRPPALNDCDRENNHVASTSNEFFWVAPIMTTEQQDVPPSRSAGIHALAISCILRSRIRNRRPFPISRDNPFLWSKGSVSNNSYVENVYTDILRINYWVIR
jgi:hypothetical protein